MSAKIKLLYLESNPGTAGIAQLILKNSATTFETLLLSDIAGYQVALNSFAPDAILFGNFSGVLQPADALNHAIANDISFILIADPNSEDTAINLIDLGADDYVFNDRLKRLHLAIVNAVNRKRQNKASFNEESALKKSEANLSAIIENTADLVYSLDRELRFITFNKRFQLTVKNVYGFDIEQGVNTLDMISAFDPEMAKKWRETYAKALNGETVQFINEYKFGDSSVFLSYSINPIREGDKIIGLSCFSRDITQQKMDEIAIKKSEASLRTIFDNTDMAFLLIDTDSKILSFNTHAQVFSVKYNHKELVEGNSVFDYFDKERWLQINDILIKIKSGEKVNYQLNMGANADAKWFDITWAAVKHQQNEDFGYLISNRDITEKRKSEIEREKITADLIQRNKDLEQFTYIISHNLRAPLANIMGLSGLLNEIPAVDHECLELVEGISFSANKLDDVVSDLNQILQISHLNEKIEKVPLNLLIEDITKSITYLVEKENVQIVCDFSEAEDILAIKSYLYSIFYNLVLNSIKYRKVNVSPVISISSKIDDTHIHVRFQDNGRGIDIVKNRKDLFGLYKRFDTSVEGKGMGLFMVKMQVESLGGTIRMESELNKGTLFEIKFPKLSHSIPAENGDS